ncbi:hypothetical protein G6F56_000676 [Rhizopus delemar]|nr:hypothetical protein G6F56_000676 [Rhizopus delemar]
MSQQLPNPLYFLKNTNSSSVSLENSTHRPRSGSIFRAISTSQSTSSRKGSVSPSFKLIQDEEEVTTCSRQNFDIKNPIGYGSSAVVYGAIYKPKNILVAIKVIELELFERNQIDELRRETALMALSRHPNILKVLGSFMNGSKLHIVTPYLSGDIMRNGFKDGFEEITIATILKQALEGLIYLHKNGHMHRDVKAGNLLMDNQGTVLLSDFGVSSSLTENSEIRKTFVGTPCWMAPEVMEQSGYNFKADIWSFGITAIELATGHAPFAKFPPMKVLMMTLNQSPPTLNRNQTKFKYSRTFKDMIDICLQKDSNKRPSAEKLILHPFFKEAKKKEYLVKSVLAFVPSLEKRHHRKTTMKESPMESSDQWDFDEPSKIDKPKHISFGGAVIKTKELGLPSPVPSEPELVSPSFTRKSRFVIEDQADGPQPFPSDSCPTPISISPPHDPHWPYSMGIGLGISDLEGNEIKRGRFSVNQSFVSKSEHIPDSSLGFHSVPISRVTSSDKGRKSRFEIQPISTEISPPNTVYGTSECVRSEPLTRESSRHQRTISSSSGKIGRFSIEKEEVITETIPRESSPECRKKGRFELMGSLPSEMFEPLPIHHSPSYDIQGYIDTLLRQLEDQKLILNDISHCLPMMDMFKLPISSVDYPIQTHADSTIDYLQQVLISSHQEKERLMKENELLRQEINQLKKQP